MKKSFRKCQAFYDSMPMKEIETMLRQTNLSYRKIGKELGGLSIRHVQLVAIKLGLTKTKKKLTTIGDSSEYRFKTYQVENDRFILDAY